MYQAPLQSFNINSIPSSLICDIFLNLSNEEVEQNQLVCNYWHNIVKANTIILPRRLIDDLHVLASNVSGYMCDDIHANKMGAISK